MNGIRIYKYSFFGLLKTLPYQVFGQIQGFLTGILLSQIFFFIFTKDNLLTIPFENAAR